MGGEARARKLTLRRKRMIARKGGRAFWDRVRAGLAKPPRQNSCKSPDPDPTMTPNVNSLAE